MIRFIAKRIAVTIPILIVVSILLFAAARFVASPEDQLNLNPRIDAEAKARYRESLGLDRSGTEQYLAWLSSFVRGDFGVSLIKNGQDVWPFVESALANTVLLASVAIVFSLLIGVTIGTISAVRQNSIFDYSSTFGAFLGYSIPVFLSGLILQLVFSVRLGWLPTAGVYSPGQVGFDLVDRAQHLVLPGIALAVQLVAVYSRFMRASMLEVLNADYIRTARSKGLSDREVIVGHGVRTALIPVTTRAAVDIGLLVGGLIITEVVFQYPGMGLLFINSLTSGDYPILLASTMIVVVAVFAANLGADVLYAVLDPRIRLTRA
ncbi:MAG: ABC transporter permease [Acidimicrobiales bacterium]